MTGPEAAWGIITRVPILGRWYAAELGDSPPEEVGAYTIFDVAIMPFVRHAFDTGADWDALLKLFAEVEAMMESGDPEHENIVAVGFCESINAYPGLQACRGLLGTKTRLTCERIAGGYTW